MRQQYTSIRITKELHKKIKQFAEKEKRTIIATLEISFYNYLQKRILEK